MTTGVALDSSSLIAGRFVMGEQLGSGPLGAVFRARDLYKRTPTGGEFFVAIKVFHEELKQRPHIVRAVLREVRKARALTHPNIVQVYDVGREGSDVYVTMELLEGESLDRIIQGTRGAGVGLEKALKIIREICNAMAYAHGNLILHTGLKPANVLVTRRGIVKVMDFGLAHAAECSGWANQVLALYDEGGADAGDGKEPEIGDDLYALACVFYELLTGKHPFDGLSAEQARKDKRRASRPAALSRSQWRVVEKALEFRGEHQFLSAADFADGLVAKPKSRLARVGWLAAITASGLGALALANVLSDRARGADSSVPASKDSAQLTRDSASVTRDSSQLSRDERAPQRNAGASETALRSSKPEFESQPSNESGTTNESRPSMRTVASLPSPAKPMLVAQQETSAKTLGSAQLRQKTRRSAKRNARRAPAPGSLQQSSALQSRAPVAAWVPKEDPLAETAALKESLLAQARANRVEPAIATLGILKERLPASDPFLIVEAPQTIADGYMRLAYDAVKTGDIEDALSLSIRGSKIAPDYPQAATARNRYLGYWEVSDLLRNGERISTSHVRFKMWRVSKLAPHEMEAVVQRWERDLTARILREQDTKLAAHLSRVGRSLFGAPKDPLTAEQMTAEASLSAQPATSAR